MQAGELLWKAGSDHLGNSFPHGHERQQLNTEPLQDDFVCGHKSSDLALAGNPCIDHFALLPEAPRYQLHYW
jgi:hypothetical protein